MFDVTGCFCLSLVITIIRIDGRISTITMLRRHLHKPIIANENRSDDEEKKEMVYISLFSTAQYVAILRIKCCNVHDHV